MINIDPRSGMKGREPLRTLYTYRRAKAKVLFGRHMRHVDRPGQDVITLRVGDSVLVE